MQSGTFVLQSTGGFAQAEWSPCIKDDLTDLRERLAAADDVARGDADHLLGGEDLDHGRREGVQKAVEDVRVLGVVNLKTFGKCTCCYYRRKLFQPRLK